MPSNVDIVKGLYDAFARGDVGGVLGAFAPDIAWREAEGSPFADSNPYTGPGAVAAGVFQRCVTEVNDFRVRPAKFTDGGETVLVEGRYSGSWASTGRPIDAQFAHVWGLLGGRIVRFQQYTDTRQWADAAGV